MAGTSQRWISKPANRLSVLERELEACDHTGDADRAAVLTEERDAIVASLKVAAGRCGQPVTGRFS